MAEGQKKPPSSKEEGYIYVSSTGVTWTSSASTKDRPTAAKLRNLRDNIYGRGISEKQKNLIFTQEFNIKAWDGNGDEDSKLANLLLKRFTKEVDLWSSMIQAYDDVFWFGISLSNPIWKFGDGTKVPANEYYLSKLRRLPPDSFVTPASGENVRAKVYCEILPGIGLNEKGEPVYFQTKDEGGLEEIKNIFVVKDASNAQLGGEPIILPIIPVITMLDYTWLAQMQKVNRTGSPILFIKIDPSHPNARDDDQEHAKKILENWGKNTAYTLRPNMELISTPIKGTSDNLETIKSLNAMIVDFFSPSGWVSKDGTLIGGSSGPETELMQSYIRGVHSWIEKAYNKLLYKYLEYNGYADYDAEFKISAPSVDRSELMVRVVEVGTEKNLLTDEEARDILPVELSPMTDKIREELDKKKASNFLGIPNLPSATQSPAQAPDANVADVTGIDQDEDSRTQKDEDQNPIADDEAKEIVKVIEKTQAAVVQALRHLK